MKKIEKKKYNSNLERDKVYNYLVADNRWRYVVEISPKRDFESIMTFIKYMNSDYKSKTGEKFKYIFIPMNRDGQYYVYGVTTELTPCETKNSSIKIIKEYSADMAGEISDLVFESEKLIGLTRDVFKCSTMFVCSNYLSGKQEEIRGYYCYEWYDVDTGYVFYVGKGTKNRWRQINNDRRNSDFLDYYNNHNCSCRFVGKNLTENDAYAAEKERLKYLHEIGQAHCNHDNGGRCGATNYGKYNGMFKNTHTDKVKKKLSDINKERQHRGKNGNAKTVYVYTEHMNFVGKYECLPDATDDVFEKITNEKDILNLRHRIYHSMNKTKKPVNGYYFSKEEIN